MGGYGDVAVAAVHLMREHAFLDPRAAWRRAVDALFSGESSREKLCPKEAFLGLCDAALIEGVPGDVSAESGKNKRYAVDAVTLLRRKPALAANRDALWVAVLRGTAKQHNGQMDVVIALWNEGIIRR
jgi:hypothetical protein